MMTWSDTGGPVPPVTVNVPSRERFLRDLDTYLAQGRGFSVVTLNLDHVVKLRRDPAFRAAYAGQSHVTADGNPIVWLSRLAGERVDLVPGADLVDPVAALAARHGVKAALVGSTEASLKAAASALARRHPGFDVVLTLAPPMGFDPGGAAAEDVITAIRDSGAGICFLAFGAPKQELLAARAAQALPGVGFLSVGAGLDFQSGTQRRAPRLVRALAAEWVWRLANDPGRLMGRYAACLALLPSLTARALAARRQTRGQTT